MTNHSEIVVEANEATTQGCEWVELDAVLKEGTGFVCRFSAYGGKSWKVAMAPADLQSLKGFQRRVAKELGLWVRHASEQERTAKLQADGWKLAVEVAWRAGS